MNSLRSILLIAGLVAFFVLGFFLGKGKKAEPEIIEQRDTVVYHDTLFQDKPVPVYVTQIRIDTVKLALIDTSVTTIIRDSAKVKIPITRKVYRDSTYRAVISGYEPQLDSIWIYNTVKEINIVRTIKIPPKRWSLGITAGPSVIVNRHGQVDAGLGATVGLQYNF